jgi:hypothetical protein
MIDEYKKRTGHELDSEVRKEFADGDVDVRNGLITICTFHLCLHAFTTTLQ